MTKLLQLRVCFAALALACGACGSTDTTGAAQDAGPKEPSAPQEPQAKFLPEVSGTCPGFKAGDGCTEDATSLICTFQPKLVLKPRSVRVWFDPAAGSGDHPLVFFWHGLGGSASNAIAAGAGLGKTVTDDIIASGAIMVALEKEDGRPVSITALPWLAALGRGADDDFLVMDEVLACADKALGVDHRRIYTTGLSAGGLQSGQVVAKRSGYIASAAIFSGGIDGEPKAQDPKNKLPVACFYGGPNDIVQPVHFEAEAMNERMWLADHGNFSILCNHGMGHMVAATAALAGWQFLQDHPFGTVPSPYKKGVPKDFPADYCEL